MDGGSGTHPDAHLDVFFPPRMSLQNFYYRESIVRSLDP